METTIKRIRELMEEQNISQKRLAAELQVAYSTLNNYLGARRWLNLSLLREVSRCLHTSADYLLNLSDQKNPLVLPDDEQQLLTLYRALPSHARRHCIQQMRQLSQLCQLLRKGESETEKE